MTWRAVGDAVPVTQIDLVPKQQEDGRIVFEPVPPKPTYYIVGIDWGMPSFSYAELERARGEAREMEETWRRIGDAASAWERASAGPRRRR